MIEKPSGTPVKIGFRTNQTRKQEVSRWLKDEKRIPGKTAFVKGFVKIAQRPEKSMLPRLMRPVRAIEPVWRAFGAD